MHIRLLRVLMICLCTSVPAGFAQDIGVAPALPNSPVHPSVLLELRIQRLIDALGISGEQEPGFRVAMKQLSELEAAYQQSTGTEPGMPKTPEELLGRAEALLAPVLYPTQVAGFRDLEIDRMRDLRVHQP
ncbi:MAG: hypothetical protein KDI28_10190 [Pseudomonadales bacterium]|nr:hypothetical protein [Pseudomonadales bacterium]MCP5358195.1 hypothetical protein [Pseudomonadales bacterium]